MDVRIQGIGVTDDAKMQVDPTQDAARVSIRPLEHIFNNQQGGHYRLNAISGTIAASAAANSVFFGFRWADTTKVAVIKRVIAGLGVTGTPGAPQGLDLEIVRATAWTANFSSNQTAITPATTAQKLRTSNMAGSLFSASGAIMVCTTAGMTGQTYSLDTAGMGYAQFTGTAAGAASTQDLLAETTFGEHPLVLATNEGFVVRNPTAYPATSTYKLGVTVVWAELSAY